MKCWVLAAALIVAVVPSARAANVGAGGYENQLSGALDSRVDRVNEGDLRGLIGGGVGAANTFVGSNDIEGVALPLIDIEWRRAYFFSTQRGLGLNIIRSPTLKIGPRLTLDAGRDPGDDSFLTGMQDIDPTIEGGVFLTGFTGPWRFKADLRRGFSSEGHEGIVASADLAYGGRVDERTSIIVGVVTHWANESYANKFYGVSASEATAVRPAFAGTAGFADFGGYLTVVFNFSERVFVSAQARAASLVGAAADSPLSEDNQQFFTGTILGYRF